MTRSDVSLWKIMSRVRDFVLEHDLTTAEVPKDPLPGFQHCAKHDQDDKDGW
jgi:hypothetical protein